MRRILQSCPRLAARTVLGVVVGLLAGAGAHGEDLDVTYIGNSGFLVSVGEQRVLIDGLYREGVPGYATVPRSKLEKIESAQPPYDQIDLVLATHHHADHFDPRSVAKHLSANPRAAFVSTPQAVELLKAAVSDFDELAPRVRAELPAEGASTTVEAGTIEVRVMNLHHGRGRNPPIQNLGFVVQMGGRRFAHFGDAEVTGEELAVHALDRLPVDVAFVGYWELQSVERRGVFEAHVNPALIVAMHLPRSDAPASFFGGAGSLEGAVKGIRRSVPDVVVFEKQFETKRITAPEEPGPNPPE